jgi:hypothetical protein
VTAGLVLRWLMASAAAALALAGTALADRSAPETFDPGTLYGRWEAAAAHCPGSRPPPPLPSGPVLQLSALTAEAFPAGRCPGKAGYRLMHPEPDQRRQLQRRLPAAWGKTPPNWVAVTCDGLDFVILAQWPGGVVAYLIDGDDSYLLHRMPPPVGSRSGCDGSLASNVQTLNPGAPP